MTVRTATRGMTLADAFGDARASSIVRDAALVVGGTALTALAAQVSFTAPWTSVPYTLQTGAVLLVGTALGLRRGALSMALYVLAGVAGLPVYAGGDHGVARLLGATGGYLLGFVLAAALVGWLAQRRWDRSPLTTVGLMALGTLLIYTVGVPVLALVGGLDVVSAAQNGAIVFLPWDALKIVAAAGLLPLAWRLVGDR
jgi:biotin transport system substrate-specific component